nr:hypothetical protein [Methylobacterium sp. ZNC0032]
MFRAAILAAATALVLGGSTLMATSPAAAPAAAAGGESAQAESGLVTLTQYYGPHYGPRRSYRPRPAHGRPHCFWSDRRVWNGWRWVMRPVRICR